VACANAAGQTIPLMIIYDAARLNPAWTKGEVPGTKYGLSSNGRSNTDLFEGWFIKHFLENSVTARPLFLLLDGHSTHSHPQLIRLAKEYNVIVLCLPPHTTHESQPLDGVSLHLLRLSGHKCAIIFIRQIQGRLSQS